MIRLLLSPSAVQRSMYASVRRLVTRRDEDGIEGRIGLAVAMAVDPMPNSTDQQRVAERDALPGADAQESKRGGSGRLPLGGQHRAVQHHVLGVPAGYAAIIGHRDGIA